MRIILARSFCLIAVLLMGSNLALSSINYKGESKDHYEFSKLFVEEEELNESDNNEFDFDLFTENDLLEELELLKEPESPFAYKLELWISSDLTRTVGGNHFIFSTCTKVPRWLLVRHILI